MQDSYAEQLRRERGRATVVWIEFAGIYRDGCNDIYAFFEGHDDVAFYMPEIRRHWSKGRVHPFRCRGKDAVLGVRDRVRARIDFAWRALFFIDKDLGDWTTESLSSPGDATTYVTEYYSIENHLVTHDVLDVICTDLLHQGGTSELTQSLRDLFASRHSSFLRRARVVMAWAIEVRRRGLQPILQNVDILRVFSERGPIIARRRGSLVYLERATQAAAPRPVWRGVLAVVRRMIGVEPKSYVRGKWELWILLRVLAAIGDECASLGLPPCRVRTQLNKGNAVEMLAGRVRAPDSLVGFLRSVLPH